MREGSQAVEACAGTGEKSTTASKKRDLFQQAVRSQLGCSKGGEASRGGPKACESDDQVRMKVRGESEDGCKVMMASKEQVAKKCLAARTRSWRADSTYPKVGFHCGKVA